MTPVTLKVVDIHGEAITFGKATLRHLGKAISAPIFLLGYILIFFTKKQQCLHDIIAKTLVLNKDASIVPSENEDGSIFIPKALVKFVMIVMSAVGLVVVILFVFYFR